MGCPPSALRLLALALLPCLPAAGARAEPIEVTPLTPVEVVRENAESSSQLDRLAAQLQSRDPDARRRAFARLTGLPPYMLGAIRKRLAVLASRRPPLERVLTIMTDFREVQGVERADAPVDRAVGVLDVLAKKPGEQTAAVAEPLLLLRSLETMGTPEAAEVALSVFALDDKAWRWESQRSLERFGSAMLPAMVRHETAHDRPWVRRFCRWGIDQLGLRRPGRAVQDQDVAVLAALLRAYGETLFFEAMPVIVSFVGDSRILVRRAARWSIEQFGRNAIWQIREAYLNATGKDADPEWSHTRAQKELYAHFDGPTRERMARALEESARALAAGDEATAREALDSALRSAPTDEALSDAAPGYAALGERALARDALAQAGRDYRRALRLDPEHPQAPRWQAQLTFVEAELRLSQGVVDLPAYERVVALDPAHGRAPEILDVLTGRAREREERWRSIVGWLAAALLAAAGMALLRGEQHAAPEGEAEGADADIGPSVRKEG